MAKSIDQIILSTFLSGLRSLLVLFLSVGFLGIGMLKVVNMPEIRAYFDVWNFPLWSMYAIGIVEIVLSVMLFYVPTRIKGLIGVGILMTGATILHFYNQEFTYLIGPAFILLGVVSLFFIEQKIQLKQ